MELTSDDESTLDPPSDQRKSSRRIKGVHRFSVEEAANDQQVRAELARNRAFVSKESSRDETAHDQQARAELARDRVVVSKESFRDDAVKKKNSPGEQGSKKKTSPAVSKTKKTKGASPSTGSKKKKQKISKSGGKSGGGSKSPPPVPLTSPRMRRGPGGRFHLDDETAEERLARVTEEKLGLLQDYVRKSPHAPPLQLQLFEPEGFQVEYRPTANRFHGRYVILAPGGRPQFHSIDNAALWVLKRREKELAKVAQLKARFRRVECPKWPAWAEPESAAALRGQCLEMLAALGNADECAAFTEAVPATEVAYAQVIAEPMDLTTMAGIAKVDGYTTMDAFRQHVALIISNALSWHPRGSYEHEDALAFWRAAQEAYIATGGIEVEEEENEERGGGGGDKGDDDEDEEDDDEAAESDGADV